eukprot:460425_1
MSWQQYVTAALHVGFTKVTIIARSNYQTIGCSSSTDIATYWTDCDVDGKKCGINENQELLDGWGNTKKTTFCFYGKKFNIVLRDDEVDQNVIKQQNNLLTIGYVRTNNIKYIPNDVSKLICTYVCDINYDYKRMRIMQSMSPNICKYIVGIRNRDFIIAYQFKSIWFIVFGRKRCLKKYIGQRQRFYSAQDAWNRIWLDVFIVLKMHGI